ncbi:MAG: flagellar M-ring protein FliF [Oscillospiraceae bacterium]|nr:flagellar M-ring protein FliF [Oscillospiraceae bacterium]
MDTKLKGVWEKVKAFFKNMSTKVRIILGASLAVVLIAIIALVLVLNNRPYATLFTNLTTAEASEIISYLQENGVTDYRLVGDTIEVRADQQDVLLAQLALAGYPKDGTLYDTYFSNVGTMSTTSERATAFKIAVEEKLAAVIRKFPGVRDADVQLAFGEERTYVFEEVNTETKATVYLDLVDGMTLSNQQVEGIRGLVSHAIEGLNIENVFITDGLGNTYSAGDTADLGDASQLKRQQEEYYNNLIRTQIVQILSGIYGEDNVRVSVHTTMDVNRRYIESTEYSQPEGSYENGGLIGKETTFFYITRDGLEPVGGVVGTTANSDIQTYVEDLQQAIGDGDTAGASKDLDNKINETHEQVEVVAGTITNISVAVTINESANAAANVDLESLRSHVAVASGIGGENPEQYVSVLLAPFLVDEPVPVDTIFSEDMIPYLIIAAAALLLLVILLIVILSIRRKRRKKKQEEEEREAAAMEEQLAAEGLGITPEAAAAIAAAAPTGGADIMEMNTEKSMELRKTVRQFVQNNPEVAAQMIKTWLKGGEEEGNG